MGDTAVDFTKDMIIAEEDAEAREFTAHGFNGPARNLLLSASAGSGKTRTLVERIVARTEALPDDRHIDSFMVVTFTEAAASELREKISKALGEKAEEALRAGDSARAGKLFKEKMLVPHATIGTIDSFMLKVVREHFADADVNPTFKIDNDEVSRIISEATDAVLEEYYGDPSEAEIMNRLADVYATLQGDDDLKKSLFGKIVDFCENLPNPEAWLDSLKEKFDTGTDVRDNYWYRILKEDLSGNLRDIKEHLDALYEFADRYVTNELPVYREKCLNQLEEDCERIQKCLDKVTQDDGEIPVLFEIGGDFVKFHSIVSPKKMKGGEVCVPVYEIIKGYRENAKEAAEDALKFVTNAICSNEKLKPAERSPEWRQKIFLDGIGAMREYIETIAKITKEILEKADETCRRRGVFSFSQIAHIALKLLNKGEILNGVTQGAEPSDIAKAYRKKYTEILIDEYQDTNMIQETALYLISGNPAGEYNQVMVGDVKQSIYGFRNAKPTLFLKKFDEFGKVDADGNPVNDGVLKILSKNYRSRKTILDAVNAVFCRTMTRATADIDYEKDRHKLIFPEDDKKYKTEDDVKCELCYVTKPAKNKAAEKGAAGDAGGSGSSVSEDGAGGEGKTESEGTGGEPGEKKELKYIELEALAVAGKILELMKSGLTLHDYDYGKDKPVETRLRYGDICILAGKNDELKKTRRMLRMLGFPTESDGSRLFFECEEVVDVINLLRVADNPRNDIPLATLLLSKMFGFDEEDLAILKNEAGKRGVNKKSEKSDFWDTVLAAGKATAGAGNMTPVDSKTEKVLSRAVEAVEKINKLRDFSEKVNVSQFVWEAVNFSGYYARCDEEAKGNLRMLLEMSRPYDSGTNSGLHGFVTFLENTYEREKSKNENQKMRSYAVPSIEPDRIKFMTVHKSKGLQFPVVFFVGTKSSKSDKNDKSPKCDEEDGIALPFAIGVDTEPGENGSNGNGDVKSGFRYILNPAPKNIIGKKNAAYERKELQRKIYVALTRAKERLYVTGCPTQGGEGKPAPWTEMDNIGAEPLVSTLKVKTAGCPFDLIWPAVANAEGRKYWNTTVECPEEKDIPALKEAVAALREAENGTVPGSGSGSGQASVHDGGKSVETSREICGETGGLPEFPQGGSDSEQPDLQHDTAVETVVRALEIADNGSLPKKISVSELKRFAENDDGTVVFGRSPAVVKARKLPEISDPDVDGDGETEPVLNGEEAAKEAAEEASAAIGPEAAGAAKANGKAGKPAPPEKLRGAEFGTLMHKCARILIEDRRNWPVKDAAGEEPLNGASTRMAPDPAAVPEYVKSTLDKLYNEGVLDDREYFSADAGMLSGFILSGRGAEVYRAANVRCEVPFTYFADVGKYRRQAEAVLAEAGEPEKADNTENGAGNVEVSLKNNLKEQKKIAIQGVIDLYYRIGDRLVIVDFKTDSGKVPEGIPLINSYKLQLRCYRDAVRDISGHDADECVLYFLRSGGEYRVEMN